MGRGHFILFLIGVMLVMTLVTQNLKRLAPLVAGAVRSAPAARGETRANDEIFRQMGLDNPRLSETAHLNKIFQKLTRGDFPRRAAADKIKPLTPAPGAYGREDAEASLLKDWLDSALAEARPQAAQTAPTAPPAQEAGAFIEILPEYPPVITNPHFTARQLRRARIMLRELRQNNTDTAEAVRFKFGQQAEEETKQIARRTEHRAEKAAQSSPSWEEFENTFEKNYTRGENEFSALIKKYVK